MSATLEPSKSQVNKAGKYLRDIHNGTIAQGDIDHPRRQASWRIVTAFRDAHAYPMLKVRNGLASMINTLNIDAAPTQRHKRVPRIVRKLSRFHETSLARLEDIGGCRVVCSAGDLDRMCRRIEDNWSTGITRTRDNIANPKEIGYRARHYVVIRDGCAIEIQVRSLGQQNWADAIEALDARRKLNLKDGTGPESLIRYFCLGGELIFRSEFELEISEELRADLSAATKRVVDEGYYSR